MNSLDNKNINLVNQQIILLQNEYRKYMKRCNIIWLFLMLITISIISICLFLIYKIIFNYYNELNHAHNFIAAIGPQLFALLLFIFLCPSILIIFSWKWMLQKRKFDIAFYRINMINVQFHQSTGIFNGKNKNEIYEKKINFIISQTILQIRKNKLL